MVRIPWIRFLVQVMSTRRVISPQIVAVLVMTGIHVALTLEY